MNAGEIIAAVRRRIPASVFPAGFSWYDVLNVAGVNFCNAHPWSWAQTTKAEVAGMAGSELIRLPDDFVSLVSCRAVDLGRDTVRVVSADVLGRERSANLPGAGYLYYVSFDGGVTQATSAEFAGQYAAIWPAPVTNGSPLLRIVYQRGWRKIPEGESGHVPNIAANAISVFLDFVEAQAHEELFDTPVRHEDRKRERLLALIAEDEARTLPTPIEPGLRRDQGVEDWTFGNDLTS